MLDAEHKLKLLLQDRPWEHEPDYKVWVEPSSKYKCEVKRNSITLALCGYVTVPKKHHYYGLNYNNVTASVHGGLTYSDGGTFGFDCAHADDLSPGLLLNLLKVTNMGERQTFDLLARSGTYRTFGWVMDETERLARYLRHIDSDLENTFIMEATKNAVRKGTFSEGIAEEYRKVKQAWLDDFEKGN